MSKRFSVIVVSFVFLFVGMQASAWTSESEGTSQSLYANISEHDAVALTRTYTNVSVHKSETVFTSSFGGEEQLHNSFSMCISIWVCPWYEGQCVELLNDCEELGEEATLEAMDGNAVFDSGRGIRVEYEQTSDVGESGDSPWEKSPFDCTYRAKRYTEFHSGDTVVKLSDTSDALHGGGQVRDSESSSTNHCKDKKNMKSKKDIIEFMYDQKG